MQKLNGNRCRAADDEERRLVEGERKRGNALDNWRRQRWDTVSGSVLDSDADCGLWTKLNCQQWQQLWQRAGQPVSHLHSCRPISVDKYPVNERRRVFLVGLSGVKSNTIP